MCRLVCATIICAALFFVISAVRYNLSVDAMSEAEQFRTIVIDAGHGGEDGGTSSVTGIREKDLNLEISLRLEQFVALCGMKPFMIRDADISVYSHGASTLSEKKVSDLKNRVRIISEFRDPVLISIHQNHFSQEKYSGAQVFYADTYGSRELAERMQSLLRSVAEMDNDRTCKKADAVYLMNNIACTGVLVECGFLSNPQETMSLSSTPYQKKLACALTCALSGYLEGSLRHEV